MTNEFIGYAEEDGIAVITLDRPEKRNAINVAMARELAECWARFSEGEARVAVLTSDDPRIFCAGADLFDPPEEAWRAIPEIGFRTDKPIIAAVEGKAIGLGFILAAMCDFCVLSEDSSLHYPEAKLGFSLGAVTAVAKRLPLRIALELMVLAEPVSGARAFDVGFANRIVPRGGVREAALAMARRLSLNAPLVTGHLKRLSLEALGDTQVQVQYAVQRRTEAMMESEDAEQGFLAFRNKSAPVFRGR